MTVGESGREAGHATLQLSLVPVAPFTRGLVVGSVDLPHPLPSILPAAALGARKVATWVGKTPLVACVALYRVGAEEVVATVEALFEDTA